MNLFGMTDIGRKRDSNQDVFFTYRVSENVGFGIVCDGMGGQNGGKIASETACSVVSEKLSDAHLDELSNDRIKDVMIAALSEANVEVYKRSNLEPGCKGMGTTAVLAVVSKEHAYIAHIGDSRAYLLQGEKLYQVTKDHSLVQELVEQGKISPEEMKTHPNKNMITRAVGVNLTVDIDFAEMPFKTGDKMLLCTDGLTNMIADEEIQKVILKNNAQEACRILIGLANRAGGTDNITVAVME